MKKIIEYVRCVFKGRHKIEYMRNNHGGFHQFYNHKGGGAMLWCKHCGKKKIFMERKRCIG